MNTILKSVILILSFLYTEISFCQKFKEPTIRMVDFIKGIDDNDYLRAELIENGFIFTHKNDIIGYDEKMEKTGESFGTTEWWAIQHQMDDRNYGNPFPIISISFSTYYESSGVTIHISVDKEFYPSYGDKLLEEVGKTFTHRKVDPQDRTEKTIYFLNYSRDIDKTIVSYSLQGNSCLFDVFKEE